MKALDITVMKLFSASVLLTLVGYTLTYGQIAQAANLISDGEFNNGIGQRVGKNEDASIGNWSYFGNITNNGGHNGLDPMAVFNFGNVAPNGFIQQAFNTEIGQEYLFEFDYRKNGDPKSQQLELWLEGASKSDLLLDTSITINSGVFQTFSHSFVADSEVTILRFLDNPNNDSYRFDMWIDNVSVTKVPTTAPPTDVPEPHLVFGLLLSTGSVFALRRRNQGQRKHQ